MRHFCQVNHYGFAGNILTQCKRERRTRAISQGRQAQRAPLLLPPPPPSASQVGRTARSQSQGGAGGATRGRNNPFRLSRPYSPHSPTSSVPGAAARAATGVASSGGERRRQRTSPRSQRRGQRQQRQQRQQLPRARRRRDGGGGGGGGGGNSGFNPLGFVSLGLPSIFGGGGAKTSNATAAAAAAAAAVTREASPARGRHNHNQHYYGGPPRVRTVKYRELVYVPVCADGLSGGSHAHLSWSALWRGPRWARREGCALVLLYCCLVSCAAMLLAYLLGFNALLFNTPTTAAGQGKFWAKER